MENNSSNDHNEKFSDNLHKERKNITCKDGFCFIPNVEETKSISNENINIFDPI
tara:strand:- start:491 stop:652 length:162 start_codon:yes stop_codon:yes gene_type:complete